MAAHKSKIQNWKIYSTLVALIAFISLGFAVLMVAVSYPTDEHRKVGQEISLLTNEIYTKNADVQKIYTSESYKELTSTTENIYTTRMSLAGGVLSAIISTAIVVALYRYLRRHQLTSKPIKTTIVIDTLATVIVMVPSMYIGQLMTGVKIEPVALTALLVSLPFAAFFSAIITFVIAKIAEWHYNRSGSL